MNTSAGKCHCGPSTATRTGRLPTTQYMCGSMQNVSRRHHSKSRLQQSGSAAGGNIAIWRCKAAGRLTSGELGSTVSVRRFWGSRRVSSSSVSCMIVTEC